MNIIGYRTKKKFDELQLDGSYDAEQLDLLAQKIIEGWTGLVLFHGDPDSTVSLSTASGQQQNLKLWEVFAKAAANQQCAFLIFSTDVIPAREPLSGFIHCYSTGISNEKPSQFEPLFRTFIDHFRQLTTMPDEQTMQKLWAKVDPSSTRIELLRLIQGCLYARKDEEETLPPYWKQKLEPYYGPGVRYSQVLEAYNRLRQTADLKKN